MKHLKFFVALVLSFWILQSHSAEDALRPFKIGTQVVVVTGESIPPQIKTTSSGYHKPLVLHPGKKGVVVGLDAARNDLVIVEWEEQYWQEWTEPSIEGYIDTNKFLMVQTGKWIKWKSFTTLINVDNLTQSSRYKLRSNGR